MSDEPAETDAASRTTVVVGVGENLGSTLAERFANEGDSVGLIARSAEFLRSTAADLRRETPGDAIAAPADIADPEQVREAFDRIRARFGPIDVLLTSIYSTQTAPGGVLDVSHEEFAGAWAVETGGVFTCAQEAARDMTDGDGGTIVFTNAQDGRRPPAWAVARSSARAALDAMARSMARDLKPDVHVAQVLIDGWPDSPALRERYPDHPEDAWIDTDRLADVHQFLVEQPPDGRSFEIDVRASQDGLIDSWESIE